MTAAQRRKINQRNAQKSTGPKTQEGKDRARRNALKHGLCASKLDLPGEQSYTLKVQQRDWIDTLQPQDPAELTCVEEAVRATIRLKRAAKAEHARQQLESYRVCRRVAEEREDKLEDLRALLPIEPAKAARQLRRFGYGCRWMAERWRQIERAVTIHGFVPTALAVEGVRMLGGDPQKPKYGPAIAFTFRFWNAACDPKANEGLIGWLCNDAQANEEHFALHGDDVIEPTRARSQLLTLIRAEIALLDARVEEYLTLEELEHNEAVADARIPSDTPKTRLWMRYQMAATSCFHRALTTLSKLQQARHAAESEAAERNEASAGSEATVSAEDTRVSVEQPGPVSRDQGWRDTDYGPASLFEEWPAYVDEILIAPVAPPVTAADGSA